MKKEIILITGGTGFVGSHLARKCVAEGHEVYLLTRPSVDAWRIRDILPKATLVPGNLADRDGLEKIIGEIKPDGIFHLAASNIMSGKTASAQDIIDTNIAGTVNLIDAAAAHGVRFFINTGSFLEYGEAGRAAAESDPCAPGELYSISKLAATLYGRAAAVRKSLPLVTLRLFTPYGPAVQHGRLVPETVVNALQNKDFPLTSPKVTRDFIYVEDLAALYLEAAENADKYKGEVFNAGTGVATNLEQFSKEVIAQTKSSSKIIWNASPAVSYDTSPWQADMTKTFSHFRWRPEHTLEKGLEKTIAWHRDNFDLFSSKRASQT